MTEFVAIPAIVAICFFGAELFKAFAPEEKNKHIPVLCAGFGAVIGVLCFMFIPGLIPAGNIVDAIAIGLASGWASTGVHQSYKQETED